MVVNYSKSLGQSTCSLVKENCWTLATRSQHRPHRVRGLSHKTAPSFRRQSQVLGSPTSGQPATHQGFPPPPPLRFDNLLEQLTELRIALCLLSPISYKGYNSGIAWGKAHGKAGEASMPSLGAFSSQDLDVFTNPEAL